MFSSMGQVFYVQAIWDAEAGVWRSESNIRGLVVEAATLAEMTTLAEEFGQELLEENHGIRGARQHEPAGDRMIFETRANTDG